MKATETKKDQKIKLKKGFVYYAVPVRFSLAEATWKDPYWRGFFDYEIYPTTRKTNELMREVLHIERDTPIGFFRKNFMYDASTPEKRKRASLDLQYKYYLTHRIARMFSKISAYEESIFPEEAHLNPPDGKTPILDRAVYQQLNYASRKSLEWNQEHLDRHTFDNAEWV